MFGEHHDIAQEFPEYKERIQQLKLSDPHFAKLYEQYDAVDEEIYRIEEQIEVASDAYTEDLKKQRLKLKDNIYLMLKGG